MEYLLSNHFNLAFSGFIFLLSTVGLFLLSWVNHSKFSFLKKYLSIPARKSTTNAVQLGGLPISLSILVGAFYLIFFSHIVHGPELLILERWTYSSMIIVLYGYLDDRFELRPIVKLVLQIFCILTFSLLSAELISRFQSALSFLIIFVWGMGTINGSNLLDGLDTLTIKLTLSTLAFYFVMSSIYRLPMLQTTTCLVMAAISGFYYFNKEPAKVHLGEIGGSFMGMSYILLSCLLFLGLKDKKGAIESCAIALLPLTLPMVELGLSFLRRIYNRKSPFRGDRLHVHHILKNYHNFSASISSSIMMLGHLFSLTVSGLIAYALNPWLGFFCHLTLMISMYLSIGVKYWKGSDTLDLSAKSIFQYLRKKDVMIIDSSKIDDFQITIMEGEEYDENDFEDDGDDDSEVA